MISKHRGGVIAMAETDNNKQFPFMQDLTNVHAGQYLSLVDDGSFKIVQVQESNVNDSYTLEPVDIENINLDLSDNYDLLQTLVENATSEKLDLSALIIEWLKQYPTVVKSAQTQADTITQKDMTIKDLTANNQELTERNQKLEKEINDLQTKKDNPTNNQPADKQQNNTSVPDQNKNVGTSSQDSSTDQSKANPAPQSTTISKNTKR